jgi:transcriptional regulator with XRE-family HTH domain
MGAELSDPSPGGTNETRRAALGCFLRKRREAIAPAEVGISSSRGRRTPGLRREEVAFLADIGVKWYARLEAGDEVHPSASTLTGIATALHLSTAEFEYILELAGLGPPSLAYIEVRTTLPEPISALLDNLRGIATTVTDRILTPLRWNALAGAIYGHSRYEHPVDRNALVRSLCDDDFIAFLGSNREEFLFRAVGMFRLNYSSRRPSPFVAAVYEKVKDDPLFQRAWNRRIVAGELTNEEVMVTNHALLGRLAVYAIDSSTPMRPDLLVRMLVPADEATATAFLRVQDTGTESPALDRSRPSAALNLRVSSV